MGRDRLLPKAAEDGEGVGGHAGKPVVGGAHDKGGPCGDGAEFADDQLISELRVIEQNIVFLKPGGIRRVIIIGVISHQNIGSLDHVFQKAGGPELVGEHLVRAWNMTHIVLLILAGCYHVLSKAK